MKEIVNIRVVLSVDTILKYSKYSEMYEVDKLRNKLKEYIESFTNEDFHIDVSDMEVYK